MTTAQKIIKYLATALAIFLIIGIISAILNCGYAILKATGLINKEKNNYNGETIIISGETTDISRLKIELETASLEIKEGENFKVETDNPKIEYKEDNGIIEIKEQHQSWKNNNKNNSLVVYIPRSMKEITNTKIETGAGNVTINKLNTQELNLKLGAGEVIIENTKVTQNLEIDGGVGKNTIRSSEINNLIADLGVGEFNFYGKLSGKSDINSGVGAVNLGITGTKEDYTFEFNKGVGNIYIDGEKIIQEGKYGSGNNYLSIDGGIGEIKINFDKEK